MDNVWIYINLPSRSPIKYIHGGVYSIFDVNVLDKINIVADPYNIQLDLLHQQIQLIVPSFNIVRSRILEALLKLPVEQHGSIVSLYSNNNLIPICNDHVHGLTWYINNNGNIQVNNKYLVANNIFEFFLQIESDTKGSVRTK